MSAPTPQQDAAIRATGNVLVVAGAGTGKTHTLIARCLRLITEQRVSIENILMVTFTDAAAAEMRSRLREELETLRAAKPDDEHLAGQIALLDTAHICTLHSFCLRLLREHFHEPGLDPQFSLLDEQQTRPLEREALDEIFERHYAAKKSDGEKDDVPGLIRTLGRGSDSEIRALVVRLHAFVRSLAEPEKWIGEQEQRLAVAEPDGWRGEFVRAVLELKQEWLDTLRASGGVPAVDISVRILETLTAKSDFKSVAEIVGEITSVDGDNANWKVGKKGVKGKVRGPLKQFFEDVAFLAGLAPTADSDPLAEDWQRCRELMLPVLGLLREFSECFDAKKRELGGVDFSDLEQLALRVLRSGDDGGPSPVAAHWRERLEFVVVDEYQDINAAQDAILSALSRDGDRPNRFLVGDVKQSIYRFRRANPRIFQSYQREWASGRSASCAALSLTENFRSRGAILDFVNALFGSLMRADVGGVDYEALQFGDKSGREKLDSKAGDTKRVELHVIARAEAQDLDDEPDTVEDGEDSKPDDAADLLAVEREARLAARRLKELKESGHKVWCKKLKEFRDVEWSDMAVLLRSPSGRAEAFAMEFKRAGVPLAAARAGFFESLEVADLLNLLRLVENPLQDIPLAAVLRSPLVGLSLDELAAIRAGAARELFWVTLNRRVHEKKSVQVTDELREKLCEFRDRLLRWRELVRHSSLSQMLETVLVETHYEALLLAEERGAERVANVRRLLDLTRQFDPYQRQGLYRFLRFVQSQEDSEVDIEPAGAPVADAVRLMSVHKSKGLEFPVVVLACLGTKFNERNLGEPVLFTEGRGLCPKLTPEDSEAQYQGLTHWLTRRDEKAELRGEELRLFYVAATRARDHLILIATARSTIDKVKWPSATGASVTAESIVSAASHWDWLRAWLPTLAADGADALSGENPFLRWRICDETDPLFTADAVQSFKAKPVEVRDDADAARITALRQRLERSYAHREATLRAAKTSVTTLRRQADEEAAEFGTQNRPVRVRSAKGRLSAAETGTAHHVFLEHLDLTGDVDESALRRAADFLVTGKILTAEQMAALDFAGLAAFWSSVVGQNIRSHAERVRREMEFTARFTAAELDALVRPVSGVEQVGSGDFVIVQGVADLVVMAHDELWLLDFKTDAVSGAALEERTEHYAVQLRLYALALGRIHRKPVTKCWLHFITARTTVDVDVS